MLSSWTEGSCTGTDVVEGVWKGRPPRLVECLTSLLTRRSSCLTLMPLDRAGWSNAAGTDLDRWPQACSRRFNLGVWRQRAYRCPSGTSTTARPGWSTGPRAHTIAAKSSGPMEAVAPNYVTRHVAARTGALRAHRSAPTVSAISRRHQAPHLWDCGPSTGLTDPRSIATSCASNVAG
jgi:hypothetical protein